MSRHRVGQRCAYAATLPRCRRKRRASWQVSAVCAYCSPSAARARACVPQGFSLPADVAAPARRRDRLEHLVRYLLRPPLALERLTESSGGQLLDQFRRPWSDGSTARLLDPAELLERLAALVPRPRTHLLVYHGLLAPHAAWRSAIVPVPAAGAAGAVTEPAAVRRLLAALGLAAQPPPGRPVGAACPSSQECWTNDDFLASDRPTLAHALGAAGYEPALIGRLHAMGPDQLHGYVHREVGDHSPNWIGVSRHDMGALADTNDPWPASVERSGPGQSDLAEDARHAAVREALTRKVLADWDPEGIRNRMQARRRDKDLLGAWARQMHPQNQYRWEFKPEENWLDATSGPEEGS